MRVVPTGYSSQLMARVPCPRFSPRLMLGLGPGDRLDSIVVLAGFALLGLFSPSLLSKRATVLGLLSPVGQTDFIFLHFHSAANVHSRLGDRLCFSLVHFGGSQLHMCRLMAQFVWEGMN